MRQEIWLFQKGFYLAHIMDAKLKRKLDFLKNFKLMTTYSYPNGAKGWDYILPAQMYKKAVKWIKNNKAKEEAQHGTSIA